MFEIATIKQKKKHQFRILRHFCGFVACFKQFDFSPELVYTFFLLLAEPVQTITEIK